MQVTYTSAGHETLAAISEELLGTSSASVARDESPELAFVEGPVGRDTLALITDLARPIRSEQSTLDYGDRTIMLHGGEIVLDVEGANRRTLDVEDLIDMFRRVRGQTLDDDELLIAE